MGTRALVRIFEGDEEIVDIYKQFDGYPEGLGRTLDDFCSKKRVVNGMQSRHNPDAIANGGGCFAAQLVAHLKVKPGNVYLCPPKSVAAYYVYDVRCPTVEEIEDAEAKEPATFEGLPIRVTCFVGKDREVVPLRGESE